LKEYDRIDRFVVFKFISVSMAPIDKLGLNSKAGNSRQSAISLSVNTDAESRLPSPHCSRFRVLSNRARYCERTTVCGDRLSAFRRLWTTAFGYSGAGSHFSCSHWRIKDTLLDIL